MTDLHIHSSFSDGTDSVEEILNKLKTKRIKYFSITDHNNIKSIKALKQIAIKHELYYLPGIEFSCTYKNKEYHVLAYGKGLLIEEISKICHSLEVERVVSDQKFISQIIGERNIDDYLNYNNNASRGGWKALNFLMDKEIISDKKVFFELYDKHGIKPEFISASKLLKILNSNNLISILAHPTVYQDENKMSYEELLQWKKWGISGIEVFTQYYNDKDEIEYYLGFCKENNLIITGGSDYHGTFHKIDIGEIELQDSSCINLLKDEFIKI